MSPLRDLVRSGPAQPVVVVELDPVLEGHCAPWGEGVISAVADLRSAESRRDGIREQIAEKRLSVEADEAAAGEEVYADPSASERLAERIVRRRTEVTLEEQSLEVALARRDEAARAVLTAQAVELRARLRTSGREFRAQRETTSRLLAELKEHEGVDYEPAAGPGIGQMGIASSRPMTRTEGLGSARRGMARMVWILERVAAGGPLATFVSASQVTDFPASLRGPAALFPGQPTDTGFIPEPVLTALLEA